MNKLEQDILDINIKNLHPDRFSIYQTNGALVFERPGYEYEEVFAKCMPYAIKTMEDFIVALRKLQVVQNKIKNGEYSKNESM